MKMELRAELQTEKINWFKKYEEEYEEFRIELLQMNAAEIRDNIEKIHYIQELYCWITYDDSITTEKLLDLTQGKSLYELADIMIEKVNIWDKFEEVLNKGREEKIWN